MVCLLRDPLSAASPRQDRLESVTLAFIVVALGCSQNYTRVTGCRVTIENLIPSISELKKISFYLFFFFIIYSCMIQLYTGWLKKHWANFKKH